MSKLSTPKNACVGHTNGYQGKERSHDATIHIDALPRHLVEVEFTQQTREVLGHFNAVSNAAPVYPYHMTSSSTCVCRIEFAKNATNKTLSPDSRTESRSTSIHCTLPHTALISTRGATEREREAQQAFQQRDTYTRAHSALSTQELAVRSWDRPVFRFYIVPTSLSTQRRARCIRLISFDIGIRIRRQTRRKVINRTAASLIHL